MEILGQIEFQKIFDEKSSFIQNEMEKNYSHI